MTTVVLKRALAVLFVLVGVGLALHFVLDPVLYDWEGGQPLLWHVFDWARAVSLPLAVIATFEAKRRADVGADVRAYIAANVQFLPRGRADAALLLELGPGRLGGGRPAAG